MLSYNDLSSLGREEDKTLKVTRVKTKDVYLRFVHLTDRESGIPALIKSLRGSSRPIPIYDLGNYYVHCTFNNEISNYEWKFESRTGKIDDVLQLHPFAGLRTDAYPVGNPGSWTHRISSPINDALFVVPHYNSFQKDNEDVFAIVEENTEDLRLTVDFSSIITKIGQEDFLFTEPPQAFLVREQGDFKESEHIKQVPLDYISKSQRVFSVKIFDIDEDSSLKFEWKINWKSLLGKALSEDIPRSYADDYYKAYKLLEDSPESSAAYSRRSLQRLLEDKANIKKDNHNLFQEIQEVINSKQLPTPLADAIDYIREVGNFGAHPMKSTNTGELLDVEPGEAEWALDILEKLFDFYFVMPAELIRKKQAIENKRRS